MRVFINVIFVIFFVSSIYAQKDLLQSGPMLGQSQMREVSIWIQTKESAKVKIGYKEVGSTCTFTVPFMSGQVALELYDF